MPPDSVQMLDGATVEVLIRHWRDGWNDANLDTIMAPFARDVVFSSPGISMLTGDSTKTTIRGYDALRTYIESALRRTRGLTYTLHGSYVGSDSIVLVYTCDLPGGTPKWGADMMRVGRERTVVEWRCHY